MIVKRIVASVVALGVAAIAACAARTAPPTVQGGPVDASVTWTWQTDGGYTWFVPGRGWTWAAPPAPATTARHVLMSVSPPATFQYVPPGVDADHALLVTGAGYISNIHCILTVVAAADAGPPLYIMGVDTASASQPTNGTVPIYGIVSGAMTAVGNDVTFSDTQIPATVSFASGLMLAVSSTADTFTAPTAGNQIRCDAKLRN